MTELRVECLADPGWEKAGVSIPQFNIAEIREKTFETPRWIHFGGGNIFRVYIADLQQRLLDTGDETTGIIVAENYDPEIIEKIYKPYDNLALAVRMGAGGQMKRQIIASVTEALISNPNEKNDWERIKEIFSRDSLQICSFTITEKGYELRNIDGRHLDTVSQDLEYGPAAPQHLMSQITALLYERYQAGEKPLAVVSMDNCSRNGQLLHDAVRCVAKEWQARGFVQDGFVQYLDDPAKVSFPWTMIDKITPRPSVGIKSDLETDGINDMAIVVTRKGTHIAPFVNTEKAEYLVIEDDFPAGRPPLEKCGVLFTDRATVRKAERMKVMTCLNPLHTALAVFGCLLGHKTISAEMEDSDLVQLIERIGYIEGMPVVDDPKIIRPEEFLREVLTERFPNPNIPDTPQRIATDTSQKIPVRFGETIKAYCDDPELNPTDLKMISLVIAAWIRYLMGIDDNGDVMEVSPDPLLEELSGYVTGISFGRPDSLTNQLKPLLSRGNIFGTDLYEAGMGDTVEDIVREMIEGPGAVRQTLRRHLNKE